MAFRKDVVEAESGTKYTVEARWLRGKRDSFWELEGESPHFYLYNDREIKIAEFFYPAIRAYSFGENNFILSYGGEDGAHLLQSAIEYLTGYHLYVFDCDGGHNDFSSRQVPAAQIDAGACKLLNDEWKGEGSKPTPKAAIQFESPGK